jgi:hypothetical protein
MSERRKTVRIGYEVRPHEKGFTVWRWFEDQEPVAVRQPSSVRVDVQPTEKSARMVVNNQVRADQSAATRLGLTVEHELRDVIGDD